MEIVEKLDSAVLTFFTNISHRIQVVTGKTNFFLVKAALYIISIDIMISTLNYWFPLLERPTHPFMIIINFLCFCGFIFLMTECDKAEQSAQSDNPTKFIIEFPPVVRLVILFSLGSLTIPSDIVTLMTPNGIFAFKFCRLLGTIAYIAFVYLVNVHPLPPGKSKIQEWMESFAAGFAKRVLLR